MLSHRERNVPPVLHSGHGFDNSLNNASRDFTNPDERFGSRLRIREVDVVDVAAGSVGQDSDERRQSVSMLAREEFGFKLIGELAKVIRRDSTSRNVAYIVK